MAFSADGGGFGVRIDESGHTNVPGVFAAGDVCGHRGPASSLEHGRLVGATIAASLAEREAGR